MTQHDAIMILIEGISGFQEKTLARRMGITRFILRRFVANETVSEDNLSKIEFFVWRNLNRNVLIGSEDIPSKNEE